MMLYEGLKFLHILSAIVAVGFNLSYGLWLARAPKDPAHASSILGGVKALDDRFATPAYVLLLLTGLGMVFEADIPFSTFWIWASLVLYGAVVVGGVLIFTPTLRRQVALADAGSVETDEYREFAVRGGVGGGIVNVIVVVIVFLMVTKPTL
jgi:uncharacterized membrane protein